MGYYIGVDGGGTFTDCAAMDDDGRLYFAKAATTKDDFAVGMFDALSALADDCGTTVPDLIASTERFSLGTTVGTNLLVERRGARTGLLATAGHGDAILIMRGTGRTAGLELDLLVPSAGHPEAGSAGAPRAHQGDRRAHRLHGRGDRAAGRGGGRGGRSQPGGGSRSRRPSPSPSSGRSRTRPTSCGRWRSSAGSLPRSTCPARTRWRRAWASTSAPWPRSSTATSPRLRRPTSSGRPIGCTTPVSSIPLLIMQISGGVLPADKAVEIPLTSLGSGPVGGIMGSLSLARQLGHKNIIATDMGGTSFEVGLIINGEPLVGEEKIIDQYRYKLPQLETTSIACGGGSLARVDPFSRSIRVGPESAGADPGPVCYRRGGTEPTVTDADVVLGLLSADGFLGGRMPLDREAPCAAIAGSGRAGGLGPDETAAGILRINNARAAELIRQQTVVRGYDPRDFVVYAYGGAGPLHAFAFAQELGVKGVVDPAGQRGLHALGLRLLHLQSRAQRREGAALLRALPGGRAEQPHGGAREAGARLHAGDGQAARGGRDRALRAHALQRPVAAQPAGAHTAGRTDVRRLSTGW